MRSSVANILTTLILIGFAAVSPPSASAESEGMLHNAARSGDQQLVSRLLQTGTDIRLPDSRNYTALHYAAANGHLEIVELLLDAGADINAYVGELPITPVGLAAGNKQWDVMERLKQRGATFGILQAGERPTSPPLRKKSALSQAIERGEVETVRELLARGVSPDSADPLTRYSPLHVAAAFRRHEIAVILLDAGANVNAATADGWTPLHSAAQDGDIRIVDLLLANGASRGARWLRNQTPLDVANNFGRASVIRVLRTPESKATSQ